MTDIVAERPADTGMYDLTPGKKAVVELPEKASQRQLHIRRAIEDRAEKKRLESMSEDNYWDNL
ncbi:hypothetical protein [Parendozoicomonas sp. Alg238-R29]|uniref:PA3496 family putative envelope integrity protein n=1 Tax=Parendozoicomonas sp. Alg238-R29 TaxID=2993446 RepID=UPI00248E6759|nr:hypothetical protein [Parendozoicomonas sp. Alg238-R29]